MKKPLLTEKQQKRIQIKIKKIKSELAADKKRWGGFYDDSLGLRYLPLRFYIQLKDYSIGTRYINWFFKNFPDDVASPQFQFECSIILFYAGKIQEAQSKLFQSFASNKFVIDHFLGNKLTIKDSTNTSVNPNLEYLEYLNYISANKDLSAFTSWVREVFESPWFRTNAK